MRPWSNLYTWKVLKSILSTPKNSFSQQLVPTKKTRETTKLRSDYLDKTSGRKKQKITKETTNQHDDPAAKIAFGAIFHASLHQRKPKKTTPRCTTKPSGKMWDVFSNAVTILNDFKAPWIMYAGSLLFYYRDCKLPHDELDIQLDLDWMNKNYGKLSKRLLTNQFRKEGK